MSQDLLREFDSLYTPPPAPPPTRKAPPAGLAPSHSRTYSSPLISPAFPVSNPPRNGTQAPQTRARGATATTFDDIIFDPNDLESFYRPKNRNAPATRPSPPPRPFTFQKTFPTEDDDIFGPGGSGWAVAPSIQRRLSASSALGVFSKKDDESHVGGPTGIGGAEDDLGDLISLSGSTTPRKSLSANSFGSSVFMSTVPPTPRTPFGPLTLQTTTPKSSSSLRSTSLEGVPKEHLENDDEEDFGEFIDSPSIANPAPFTFSHVPKKSSISLRKFATLPKPLPMNNPPEQYEPRGETPLI
ncbi:hypothetical protein RUND412_010694 [Rhizina undulata]